MRCAVHATETDARAVAAEPVMGTMAGIDLRGPGASPVLAEVVAELHRLERLWSRFLPGSDVSRLNRACGGWVVVAPETASLLRQAEQLRELTDGAFDVALRAGGPIEVVDDRVRLGGPARIDLGGIGKGAAVHRVLGILRGHGIEAAMVNLGRSSIGTLGAPAGRERWRIALDTPARAARGTLPVLSVSGGHVSTSGADRVIDPQTGEPAGSGVRTATVLCDDGARAEALSTALVVLGVTRGLALHGRLGDFDAVLIDDAGVVHASPGLQPPVPAADGFGR